MRLPYISDGGYGAGTPPAIGVVILSTDETLEPELKQISTEKGTSIYHSRIPFDPNVTPETLAKMEENLPASIALFPARVNFKAIGYGCTSGATVIGSNRIAAIIQEQFPDSPVTDPIAAVIAACNALGVKRLGMVTPYRQDVSLAMISLLEKNGISISEFASFEEELDHKVARISETSTYDAAVQVGAGDCDAVFTSCTNLRSFGMINAAETALGKPVISSNSAFAWHLHRLAGVTGQTSGPGKLFKL